MKKLLPFLLSLAWVTSGLGQGRPSPPATQEEVDAGTDRFKHLTPFTFQNAAIITSFSTNVSGILSTNTMTNQFVVLGVGGTNVAAFETLPDARLSTNIARLSYIDPRLPPYNATPDGVTDNTAALTNAFNDAMASRRPVYLGHAPDSPYVMTVGVKITNVLHVIGRAAEGNSASTGGKPDILWTGSGDVFYTDGTLSIQSCTFRDLYIRGEGKATSTGAGFRLDGSTTYDHWQFRNVQVESMAEGWVTTNMGTTLFDMSWARANSNGFVIRGSGALDVTWLRGGAVGSPEMGYLLGEGLFNLVGTDNSGAGKILHGVGNASINVQGCNFENTGTGGLGIHAELARVKLVGASKFLNVGGTGYSVQVDANSNLEYTRDSVFTAAVGSRAILATSTYADIVAFPDLDGVPIATNSAVAGGLFRPIFVPTLFFDNSSLSGYDQYGKMFFETRGTNTSHFDELNFVARPGGTASPVVMDLLQFEKGRRGVASASGWTNDFTVASNVTAAAFLGDGQAITIDASGFDGNLTTDDDTLQEVAQKLDDLVAAGGSGNTNLTDTATGAIMNATRNILDGNGTGVISNWAGAYFDEMRVGVLYPTNVNGSTITNIHGTNVVFDDPDSNFSASNVEAAIAELDDTNGSGPNASDGKVSWTQLVSVPAGFADGTDDGGGTVTAQTNGVDSVATDVINFIAGTGMTITSANDSGTNDLTFTANVSGDSLTNLVDTANGFVNGQVSTVSNLASVAADKFYLTRVVDDSDQYIQASAAGAGNVFIALSGTGAGFGLNTNGNSGIDVYPASSQSHYLNFNDWSDIRINESPIATTSSSISPATLTVSNRVSLLSTIAPSSNDTNYTLINSPSRQMLYTANTNAHFTLGTIAGGQEWTVFVNATTGTVACVVSFADDVLRNTNANLTIPAGQMIPITFYATDDEATNTIVAVGGLFKRN